MNTRERIGAIEGIFVAVYLLVRIEEKP